MTPTSVFMQQLVGSPCCLPMLEEAELFEAYSELGFRKFEGFSSWAACRHEWQGDPYQARQRAQRYGLAFTSYHLPPITDDVEPSFAAALAAARYASKLGAKIVLLKAQRRELFRAVGRRFLDALEQEALDLVPVLQNHAGSAITTLEDYREVLAAFEGDSRISTILEVGHFQRIGVPWQAGWELLQERIALIHVNEIRAGKSVHYGTGEVDFGGLVRQIKASGYVGDVVVELELENNHTEPKATLDGLKSALALLCNFYEGA